MLAVADRPSDTRRVNKARGYFRERQVHDFRVRPGVVTALVQGSQLEPFETGLRFRTVEPDTVVTLLRAQDATDDLLAVARGEQPSTLGAMVLPTEAADLVVECSCPDDEPHCIHVLAVAYELAARIDDSPGVALAMMGADVPTLLTRMRAGPVDGSNPPPTDSPPRRPSDDPFAIGVLPLLPEPPDFDVLTDLDSDGLTRALRASGVAALDVAEVVDELAELYARVRGRP
ncbi:SWIM zinc finger family protein [Williamsia sp. SKLECPSW1]